MVHSDAFESSAVSMSSSGHSDDVSIVRLKSQRRDDGVIHSFRNESGNENEMKPIELPGI